MQVFLYSARSILVVKQIPDSFFASRIDIENQGRRIGHLDIFGKEAPSYSLARRRSLVVDEVFF
jgi:hypothetical protein